MNPTKLQKMILDGWGQGRGEEFKPFLRISRGNPSRSSSHVFTHLPIHRRSLHLMSGLEYKWALILGWLGADEIREGQPLWPMEHQHLGCGLDSYVDRRLPSAPGLLDISKQAGIDHGVYPGTTILYVATNDLNARFPELEPWESVLVSCKPKVFIDLKPRARERLELERLYCQAVSLRHVIATDEMLNDELVNQLDWLVPTRAEFIRHMGTARMHDFCSAVNVAGERNTLHDALSTASMMVGVGTAMKNQLFRVGVWSRAIDLDLRQRIEMSRPPKRDGGATVRHFRQLVLGKKS